MYLYYEHHRDEHGKILLSEMRLSSDGSGELFISHKNPREQLLKNLCVPILKWPPIAKRSMNERNWCWTYFDDWGEQVIDRLKEVTRIISEIQCIEVEDLAAQAMNHKVSLKKRVDVRDFFYQQVPVAATPTLTKEQVAAKLRLILGTDTVDKSSYRRAALRLHPDRNNGDGKPMSELNMLWQVYNA